ncbi:hypothetical protein HD806DRAFT_551874 [Xylariaceae sp. AK1471]|nr:hypothetical protein HD806DRAFT_551874 [Xylariaceae sp. AK1471]
MSYSIPNDAHKRGIESFLEPVVLEWHPYQLPQFFTSHSTQLLQFYSRNKFELTKHISAAVGAEEHLWGGDDWCLRWHETSPSALCKRPGFGYDDSCHNLIEFQNIPEEDIKGAVNDIVARFHLQRRRFNWVVGPKDQPLLELVLRTYGLIKEDEEPAMVCDLGSLEKSNLSLNSPPNIQALDHLPSSPSTSQLSPSAFIDLRNWFAEHQWMQKNRADDEKPLAEMRSQQVQPQQSPDDVRHHLPIYRRQRGKENGNDEPLISEIISERVAKFNHPRDPPPRRPQPMGERDPEMLKKLRQLELMQVERLSVQEDQYDTATAEAHLDKFNDLLRQYNSLIELSTTQSQVIDEHKSSSNPQEEQQACQRLTQNAASTPGAPTAPASGTAGAEMKNDLPYIPSTPPNMRMPPYLYSPQRTARPAHTVEDSRPALRSVPPTSSVEPVTTNPQPTLLSHGDYIDDDTEYMLRRQLQYTIPSNYYPETGHHHQRRQLDIQLSPLPPIRRVEAALATPEPPVFSLTRFFGETIEKHTIETVEDLTWVRPWVKTWAHTAVPSSPGIDHWTHVYKRLLTTLPPTQFQMFLARRRDPMYEENHRVIGTGYLHFYEGVAAVHCLAVRPEFRKQGVGRDLVRFAKRRAREMGYHMMMATATRGGLKMLRKADFRDIGRVKLYTFHPKPEQPVAEDPLQMDNEESGGIESSQENGVQKEEEADNDDWEVIRRLETAEI